MGATYTRQSSFTDGDVITADLFNNEYDQLLAAFAASTGHTHDGTAAEGGPITKLLGTSITIGDATSGTDITVTFDGETNDGVFKWMEDEDYFEFSDDLLIASTEKIQFRDTAIYINSSTDGQLDIVADSEIQIAATTIDINGNVDISGTLTIGGAGISEAELEILDGATVTTTEINILDGDTTASSTTVADADRVVFNDAGTMKQVAVTDLAAYFDDEITAMPNLVTTAATTVGALNSGSITSGFGTIDTGSSTITTTGLISGGSLDIDDVLINGTTIGHTDDTDLITLANGVVTVAGEVSMTTLDIGGTNVTSTAAELNIVDGGTSATATTVVDADRVVMNDNGTMVQVAVTDLAAYFDDEITAMPNLVTTAATTVGALNSGSITSGFGTIDTGSSAITTTGVITGGTLEATTDTAAGDNAAIGYTAAEGLILTGQGSTSDITLKNDADATVFTVPTGTDDILFPDNAKILMGAGSDLQVYHDGLNSIIADFGTGILDIKSDGAAIQFSSNTGELYAYFANNGAAQLFHDNVKKFETTSTGVDVTGIIVSDGMSTNTSGTSNFIAGVNAGNSITSGGNNNTLIGDEAGTAITTGDNNTAVGKDALKTEDAHGKNTAVGTNALEDLNAGADGENVAVGYDAGSEMTLGIKNVLVGSQAGDALTHADFNVSVGMGSLTSDTLGSKSVAIGTFALLAQNFTTATDSNNTAVGNDAGKGITTGVDNTLIGGGAGDALTDADNNVAVGRSALGSDTLGSKSTAVGRGALGAQNFTTATDSNNTAVGYTAGNSVTTGTHNSFLGAAAGLNVTTGDSLTLIGSEAGDALTIGKNSVAVGKGALGSDVAGKENVAIGNAALFAQNFTTATNSFNTAVGSAAGVAVTTGVQNTFVGALAGDGTDDGLRNTAVGYLALSANADNDNTAIGVEALSVTTAANSTAVGQKAGSALTSGSNCLFLGQNAGLTGHPGGNFTTQSNVLVIGNVSTSAAHVQVDWTVASDQRDKTDFTALDLGLDFVKALAPVTYKWDKRAKYGDITADDYDLAAQTPDGTHKEDWLDIGFKAQEVQALEEAAGYTTAAKKNLTVSTSSDGKQMGLQYSKFVPILVKAIQEQNALIEALTARIATLEG